MFIDTHAHLTDKAFSGDCDKVIEKSYECMVERIITSGYNLPSSKEALELAKKYDNIYCSVGVYPENILELDSKQESELIELASQKKVVAIGEIGLQYTEGMPERDKQKEGFVRQLEIARNLKLPVVIHCRDAYGNMLDLLKANRHLLEFGGTMHCFSGSSEVASELVKLGLHISVGGVSTFKNATKLQETLAAVPLEKIILETDCPYLTPHPYRGSRNAPYYIPTIAENLARLKGVEVSKVAEMTTSNAKELFRI